MKGPGSSLIERDGTSAHKNSLRGHTIIAVLSLIDRHSKIVVVRVKVLELQSAPKAHEEASIEDRSPRNSGKAVRARNGQSALMAEVVRGAQTTAPVAEVPDTLSSSFDPPEAN